MEWAEKDRGGKKGRKLREEEKDQVCVRERDLVFLFALGPRVRLVFSSTHLSVRGPPGREQKSVGWRGVS